MCVIVLIVGCQLNLQFVIKVASNMFHFLPSKERERGGLLCGLCGRDALQNVAFEEDYNCNSCDLRLIWDVSRPLNPAFFK